MLDKELELVDIHCFVDEEIKDTIRISHHSLRLRIWGEYECSLLQLSLNINNLFISTWIRSGYLSVVPMKFRNIFVRRLEMIHKVEDSKRKSIRVLEDRTSVVFFCFPVYGASYEVQPVEDLWALLLFIHSLLDATEQCCPGWENHKNLSISDMKA